MIYFTSDWHLNGTVLLDNHLRPFKSIEKMNQVLINNANNKAKYVDDLIVHCGDFIQYGKSGNSKGIKENPKLYINQLNSQLLLLKGNHDSNNKVKTYLDHLQIPFDFCNFSSSGKKEIRKYISSNNNSNLISISHFPSISYSNDNDKYTKKIKNWKQWICGIHLHGHFHFGINDDMEKIFWDHHNNILNINISCDLWNYTPVSLNEITNEILKFIKNHNELF